MNKIIIEEGKTKLPKKEQAGKTKPPKPKENPVKNPNKSIPKK